MGATVAVQTLDLGAPRATRPLTRTLQSGEGMRVANVLRVVLGLLLVANLGRIPVFSVGVKDTPFLLNDLLVVILLGLGALAALRSGTLRLDGPALFALLFASVGAFSALLAIPRFGLAPVEFAISVAYLARWLAYFGVYLVVINFVRPSDVPAVWGTLEATILVFAGFGIFQSLFLPGFAQLVDPGGGWDLQGHRLVSTFLDPNFAGALIAVALLVLVARMSFGVRTRPWKLFVLSVALLLTISRSSILAFVAGLGVIFLIRGLAKRVLRFGAVLLVLLLPFVPLLLDFATRFGRFSLDGSAALRMVSWLRAIEIFLDNPVLGIGFNTYGFVQEFYGNSASSRFDFSLDGGLLFVAVMTGVVGLIVYSAMILLVLMRCRRIWRDPSRRAEDRGLSLGIVAATVALVVHSIFLNSLLLPLLMEPLWVLWGLSFVLSNTEIGKEEGSPNPGGRQRRITIGASA